MIDSLRTYLSDLRTDPETGQATYAVVQAEDEIGAIGMIIGAGWAGARAMTATSGPGLSLMTEFAGLAYYAEVPAVVWDVQRMGPSTGLPTRTAQGDVLTAYFLGHGDTKHVVLFPCDVHEAFEFGWKAFDLADRLQTPVFVLSDLDLGMNLWMSDPFEYPETPHRSRQGVDGRRPGPAGQVWPLRGRGRRRYWLPHAARHRSPAGGLLCARHRPQRGRAYTANAPTTG